MYVSAYDLETHARTHQDDLLREAERDRLAGSARGGGGDTGVGLLQRLAARLTMTRTWLAIVRARVAPHQAVSSQPSATPTSLTMSGGSTPPRRPFRAAESYAGLVVIARANAIPVAERPRRVGEG